MDQHSTFPQHSAFPLCAAAASVFGACEGLADDLRALGYDLPSVYLVVEGRLRCQATRGYFQVVDGFTPGVGVIGGVVASGAPVVLDDVSRHPEFIAALPGVRAEACVPVRLDDQVVGAVNVESLTSLPEGVQQVLEAAAQILSETIAALGGLPPVGLSQRLARVAIGLSSLHHQDEIAVSAVEGAIDFSGMDSAALCLRGADGRWSIAHAAGPLATHLTSWSETQYRVVAGYVKTGTSSHFRGDRAHMPAEYEFLLRAGVGSVMVHPLVLGEKVIGLLTTAHGAPLEHDPIVGAAVELLAVQVAACLGMAAAMQELSRRARQDPLTGLYNASTFAEDLAHIAATGPRAGTACLIIDIDYFKEVNDTFGHPAGDQLLRDLASELSAVLRSADTLYRIGGDELATVLKNTTANEMADVSQRLVVAARRVRTTVSVGAAMLRDGESVEELRIRADRALYQAKSAGRDHHVAADA